MLFAATTTRATALLRTAQVAARQSAVRRGHGGSAERGFEPSGYFLGRPNAKRDWYWWEPLWYFGYYGTFIAFFTVQAFSPKQSITEQSKVEAHRRMSERGETFGWPFPADYSLVKKE
ncbi:hypothetical protein HDU88_000256 [Geranomyces variabilis]|nr:hypothetical protein HDU88_000256 [Geranomyces variabilis]